MANLKYGSTGDEVKKLQTALGFTGKDVDGVFGKKTQQAVINYQKANKLTADGIAGKNTQGKLYSTGSNKGNTGGTKKTNTGTQKANAGSGGSNNTGNGSAKPTTTPATKPATTPTATNEVKPFTYDDFSYDKEFSYDDFSYDKQFSYGDFSYNDFSYADYVASDAVTQANTLLQQQIANKPGAYQSQWQDKINDYMSQIENRDPFSYDFNSDALYQQYKDNYIQQGQMAMMDAMGQAAAMTGGYGNSYSQTVGQQAYNQQLSQLNNIMPELYQMAFDRYAYEGEQLQNMYNMYLGREEQDYGRYIDSLNAWQAERDYLASRYDSERDYDYSKWEGNRDFAYNEYTSDRNLEYDKWSSDRNLAYDQYTADRNLAFDKWQSGRDLAYDEFVADRNIAYDNYSAGRNEAFSNYQTNQSQAFTASENEKDRAATASENEKSRNFTANQNALNRQADREAAAVKAAASTNSPLNTEDTLTWAKRFENATSLADLEKQASLLQGIVGPEVAGAWFDIFAGKFKTDEPKQPKKPNSTGGSGGGTMYYAVK